MAKAYTLGKRERLKSRKLIEQVFKEGRSYAITPFKVFYTIAHQQANIVPLQFGVGVSSRYFKKAVDRNRIKRLVREGWRLQKNRLQEQLKAESLSLQIFIIYTGREIPAYEEVYDKIGSILKKQMALSIK